ncbi:hypothetical protein ORV05_32725 [Amycolatopsis cynarae]|uniref:HNH endonuclease n=1 Tax=Amycolatopsis cynarae TaxID=2995223 RepID=A0ABY7B0U9_9PSEU|nr:hypothetical protein [Amycolatopsis sp. HUAS 11-8]WAL65594.1 hypothetical protein ORV05_32725 [Amycolatopsis sp. HUAS 11-8]
MGTGRITSLEALEALFPLVDEDISAVARDEAMAAETAEIDALIEEAEREWIAAERIETFRVSRDLTDQRSARRLRRRDETTLLRSLTVRLDSVGPEYGEAA